MASTSGNGRMAPGLKAGALWSFSLATSVLLNLVLFGLMPHLSRTSSDDRLEDIERPHAVHFIRIRQPDSPPEPEKKSEPPSPPEVHTRTGNTMEAVIERPKPSFGELRLPLKLDTHLPAPDLSLPALEMKTVSVQAPPLKDFYSDGELDAQITPLVRVPPAYPIIAKKRGIEGWVKVKFLVNESGRVDSVDVLDCSPEKIFDDAVVACVSSWRFEPGTVDGTPVNVWAETTIRFELR